MPHKILIVDDEKQICEELSEYLSSRGYACETASGTGQALEALHGDSEPAIVLTDIKMPGRDGLDLIATAQAEIGQNLEFIIITGHGDTDDAISALRLGAHDFLQKPIDLKHLNHVVQRADRLLYLRRMESLKRESLEAEVDARTAEVQTLLEDLSTAYEEGLDILALAAEYKDPETGDHIRRIGAYAALLVSQLDWSQDRQDLITLAAPLHDVGKIGTPDAVLLKTGKLDPDEMAEMQKHAEIGYRILSLSKHPVMQMAANIAWCHHEHWSGDGYPRGLAGKDIPVEARLVAFGDIYDALRSDRAYKEGFDHAQALNIMIEGDGRTMPGHFDPELMEVFRDHTDSFGEIFTEFTK